MGETEVRKLHRAYFPDTNVLMLNALAPYILAGDWDEVQEDTYGNELADLLIKRDIPLDKTPNTVIITSLLEDELDSIAHSSRKDVGPQLAVRAIKVLERLRQRGQHYASSGLNYVELDNGAKIYFMRHDGAAFDRNSIPNAITDDRILFDLQQVVEHNDRPGMLFQFVSQDTNARNKCRDMFVSFLGNRPDAEMLVKNCTKEFEYENIEDPNQRYTGIREFSLTREEYNALPSEIDLTDDDARPQKFRRYKFNENQFIALDVGDETKYLALHGQNGKLIAKPLQHSDKLTKFAELHNLVLAEEPPRMKDLDYHPGQTPESVTELVKKASLENNFLGKDAERLQQMLDKHIGDPDEAERKCRWLIERIKAERHEYKPARVKLPLAVLTPVLEQSCALELLFDSEKTLVSIDGTYGSGKTILSVGAALAQVLEGRYRRIMYIRPMVGLDEGPGWLKGGKEKKIEPWMEPCKISLEVMLGIHDATPEEEQQIGRTIRDLEQAGIVKYEIPTWQAGVTWHDYFVIVDEAHNLSREQTKMFIGRIGEKSKAVFIGDPSQIKASALKQHPYLHERNNGFSHMVERLKGEHLYGHITMSSPEVVMRSVTARLARLL